MKKSVNSAVAILVCLCLCFGNDFGFLTYATDDVTGSNSQEVNVETNRNNVLFTSNMDYGTIQTSYFWENGNTAAVESARSLLNNTTKINNQHIIAFGAGYMQESQGAALDFTSLDARVDRLESLGGECMLTFCSAPGWMLVSEPADHYDAESRPKEEYFDDYADICAAVAQRYTDIKYFQVWNEFKGFWDSTTNWWDVELYTEFYNDIYTAVKAVRPDAIIGGFYMSIRGDGANDALNGSYGSDSFDPISYDDPKGGNCWDSLQYFLNNVTGIDFLCFDRAIQGSLNTAALTDEQVFKLIPYYQEILHKISTMTTLPLVMSEFYGLREAKAQRDLSDDFKAAEFAVIYKNMLMGVEGRDFKALLWSEQNDSGYSLFTHTGTSSGGQSTPLYDVTYGFTQYFCKGSQIIESYSDSDDIEVLASTEKTMVINKTTSTKVVKYGDDYYELQGYEVLFLNTVNYKEILCDFDSIDSLVTSQSNSYAASTPLDFYVFQEPQSESVPYFLDDDENGGKMVKYLTSSASSNSNHTLRTAIYAAPYTNIQVKANIKSDGTLNPIISAITDNFVTLGYTLTGTSSSFVTYTFRFNMGANDKVTLVFAMGSKNGDLDTSYNGTSYIDDVVIRESSYNLAELPDAGTVLPSAASNGPKGLSVSSAAADYYSVINVFGEPALEYDYSGSSVITGTARFTLDVTDTSDKTYIFKCKAKVPRDSTNTSFAVRIKVDDLSYNKYGPDGMNCAQNWNITGASNGVGYDSSGRYKLTVANSGVSLYPDTYQEFYFPVKIPANTGIIKIHIFCDGGVNTSSNGNFIMKDIEFAESGVSSLLSNSGFRTTPSVSLNKDASLNEVTSNDGFTIISKNNAIVKLFKNDVSMTPLEDFTIIRESQGSGVYAYTVKFTQEFSDSLTFNDTIKLMYSDRTFYEINPQFMKFTFNDMTSLTTTTTNNNATSTPFTFYAIANPSSETNPYSLVSDGNGGQMIRYSTASSTANSKHDLRVVLYAAPYSNIQVKAKIESNGTLNPLIKAVTENGTTLGYTNTSASTSFGVYTFKFNMGSNDKAIIVFSMGSVYGDLVSSHNGTSYLDDVVISENSYNMIQFPEIGTALPAATSSGPLGLSVSSSSASYYSTSDVYGSSALVYDYTGTSALSGTARFTIDATSTVDKTYWFKCKIRVPRDSSNTAFGVRVRIDDSSYAKYGPDGKNCTQNWNIDGASVGVGYDSSGRYKITVAKNGISKYMNTYQEFIFPVKIPANTGIIKIHIFADGGVNTSANGEFIIKDLEFKAADTNSIVSADGFRTAPVMSLTGNDALSMVTSTAGFTATSKNNAPVRLVGNGKTLVPIQDFNISRQPVQSEPETYLYTIKISSSYAATLVAGDTLRVIFSDGSSFITSIT